MNDKTCALAANFFRNLNRCRTHRFGPVAVSALAALCSACGQRTANAEPPLVSSEPGTTTLKVRPGSAEGVTEPHVGDMALRRGYGVVDMRFEQCVKPQGDSVLKGEACSSGFLIYGPYVNVPDRSEIEVSFEINATTRVEIYSDIVSQMGKQLLAGLNPQVLEAGVSQRLGYKVTMFKADSNIESRIGVRAAEPSQFTVSNLTMTVR